MSQTTRFKTFGINTLRDIYIIRQNNFKNLKKVTTIIRKRKNVLKLRQIVKCNST